MSIDFKSKDFFYPLSILKFRSFLEKSQWSKKERLEEYQLKRLQIILKQAYEKVPYYQKLFRESGISPTDIASLEDLKKIPLLSKNDLRKNFKRLTADNALKFKPYLCRTSGTSGEPLQFYLDKPSNILEFCYYWRYWSWAGYRLGSPFAEFSIHHFLNHNLTEIYHYSRLMNRLILNSTQVSYENMDKFIGAIKKYRPLFLKGAPATLYVFCLLLEKRGYSDLYFEAVFSTGEILLPVQREKIERVLHCKILDSYGHMERTVAISQCPEGAYHIHSEYGILEVDKNEYFSSEGNIVGQIIGTALHNFAMPLIRYKTTDLVEIDPAQKECRCGRSLPMIKSICGRGQDIIITKDGHFITNLFVFFEFWKGILWFQLIQEELDKFSLNLVRGPDLEEKSLKIKVAELKNILGRQVSLDLEFLKLEEITPGSLKCRPIISRLDLNKYI